ncbi:hypothetical protein EIP86_011349 [Pleurotus ostreatoroseus]|nr:hypothetical protein EIP86_011349 [Pleurotus ostreatoroseus]
MPGSTMTHYSTLRFRTSIEERIFGNLGESLDHDAEISWDDEAHAALEPELLKDGF